MHELNKRQLRRDLIGAGIAPRHVRRTIDELQDHYDDVVEQELSHSILRPQNIYRLLGHLRRGTGNLPQLKT